MTGGQLILNCRSYELMVRRFRTLTDRLLGLRLVSARRVAKRDVSYEFMNRQMVWHAFTVSYLVSSPVLLLKSPAILGIPLVCSATHAAQSYAPGTVTFFRCCCTSIDQSLDIHPSNS